MDIPGRLFSARSLVRRLPSALSRLQAQPRASMEDAYRILMGVEALTEPIRPVSQSEAQGYPPFDRCCDLIASSLANLDLQAGRVDPGTAVWSRLADQPAVLADPDPQNDPWQWRYSAVMDLLLHGNHVAVLGDPDWRTMRPGWLVPLPPEHLGIVAYGDGSWDYVYGGQVVDRSLLLHIKRGGQSGQVLGEGLLSRYACALRGSVTGEEWAARYLAGGGLPPAIIQSAATPNREQGAAFKQLWRTMMATGEAMVVPSNVTITPLVSDAERQQLVQARQWNAQMACIATGVPTHKLGLPGPSMTYQNVEQADIAFRVDTLERYGQPIANVFDKHLMPSGTTVRWQWAQTERADVATQVQVTAQLVSSGLLSVDEARARLHYPPMASVGLAGQTREGVPEPGTQEV